LLQKHWMTLFQLMNVSPFVGFEDLAGHRLLMLVLEHCKHHYDNL